MSSIRLEEQLPAAIPTPPAGKQTIFLDSGTGHFSRKDSGGATTDVEAGAGDVNGPAAATDNAITRFDGTTGKIVQNSPVTVDDSGNISLPAAATVDGRDVSVDAATFGAYTSTLAAQLSFGAGSVASTTTTRYLYPNYDSGTAQTSEPFLRVTRAGTLAGFYVQHATGAGNGNAIVYTVRVNGVATAITVSLASTATQGADTTNTVAVAAGDRISVEVTKAASVGTSPSDIVAALGLRG